VAASEVPTQGDAFRGALIFSVGCHSGLNLPDGDFADPQQGTDWAQAFVRRGATYIGNTGYAYGDGDLLAYSERLMLNFVQELGYVGQGPQTVGRALMRAKQRYYNSAAAGSFSSYDEKILAIPTIYGLPMIGVTMPQTSSVPPGGASLIAAPSRLAVGSGVLTSTVALDFSYESGSVPGIGEYRQVAGSDDLLVVGNRPVQPRATRVISAEGKIAHGALLVGGAFSDTPNFNPVISRRHRRAAHGR
jgi:hypothetical protein